MNVHLLSGFDTHRDNGIWENLLIACPNCGRNGTFEKINPDFAVEINGSLSGFSLNICPNPHCRLVVVGQYQHSSLARTYPGSTKSTNTENVPKKIAFAFQEAVECYSNNCFIASAIMIRKTLEEICSANCITKGTLFKKLSELSDKIIIPQALKDGMHDLRLLGNDAAHVESTTYSEIGPDELSVSIDFTQEIIKALYQYEGMLEKLRNLKHPKPSNVPPAPLPPGSHS